MAQNETFKKPKKMKQKKWIQILGRRIRAKHISCYVLKANTKNLNPEWKKVGEAVQVTHPYIVILFFTKEVADRRVIYYFGTTKHADSFLARLDWMFLPSKLGVNG